MNVYEDETGNGQSPHEIFWYRFQLSLQDVFDAHGADDAALGRVGAKLFKQAMTLPAGFGLGLPQ